MLTEQLKCLKSYILHNRYIKVLRWLNKIFVNIYLLYIH